MTQKADGMNYAPQGKPAPVVKPGEFVFAATHLDHGHIYGQCNGLIEAGGELKWVYDADPRKVEAFREKFPDAKVARSFDEVLADGGVNLVTSAGIPCEHAPIGIRVLEAGKDYFTDKTPLTSLDQLDQVKAVTAKTGRKYMVYFSERLHVESAMFATELVAGGAIGQVVQYLGLGPHRLNKPSRPAWFFKKALYGGILCDICSHQTEQFLTFTGATDATVTHASVGNVVNRDTPEFEDFGDANFLGNNGASAYMRVDWYTPNGLSTWGDGRVIILGTKGYIELRKYVDVARDKAGDNVYIVDNDGERYINVAGKVGFPFFGKLILDVLNRTDRAMTQAHVFKAAELAVRAQMAARRIS